MTYYSNIVIFIILHFFIFLWRVLGYEWLTHVFHLIEGIRFDVFHRFALTRFESLRCLIQLHLRFFYGLLEFLFFRFIFRNLRWLLLLFLYDRLSHYWIRDKLDSHLQ